MGSCEHSALVDESLCGSRHLLPAGEAKGLLRSSLAEGCRKSVVEPHSCMDQVNAVSQQLHCEGEVKEHSVPKQQSCSEVACTFSKKNVGNIDVPDGSSCLHQDYCIDFAAGTLHCSNADCVDAPNECQGSSRNCSSSVSLGNAAEMSSVNRIGVEGEHQRTNSLVPEKTSHDECGASELCSNGSQTGINSCNLETDMFCSEKLGNPGKRGSGSGNNLEGCELPLEVLPLTATTINYSQQNEEKDDGNVGACSVERDAEVVGEKSDVLDGITVARCSQMLGFQGGEMPSNLLDMGCSPNDSPHQKEQDTESVSGPSMERVLDVVGEKDDASAAIKVDFHAAILNTEKNACNSNVRSSGIALDCAVEKSDSVQSSQCFGVVDNDTFKYLTQPNLSGTHAFCAFNSNSVVDCCGQTDPEGKDSGGFDYASGTKCSEITRSSPRRSARVNNSRRKTQTKTAAKKCRKAAKGMLNKRGIIEIFLKTARRKRSCFCKPARSSSWGLLGNIARVFEQLNGLGANQVQNKASQIASAGHRSGKRSKNRAGECSRGPMVKHCASTSRIRLKVKVGKEASQNSLEVIIPDAVDSLPPVHTNDCQPETHWGTSAEFPLFANGVEDDLGKELPRDRHFQCLIDYPDKTKGHPDASVLDVNLTKRDRRSTVIPDSSAGNSGGCCKGISSQLDVESLGGATDNRYLDPGTSPDSEVINLAPDSQAGDKVQEYLHDTTLNSSGGFAAHGDVRSSNLSNLSGKKGKKTGKLPKVAKAVVEGGSLHPANKSKVRSSKKHRHRDKSGDASGKSSTSSSKEISRETFPSSGMTEFGVCHEALKLEHDMDASLHSSLDVGVGSFGSQYSKKLLPSCKSKGHKAPKSSKSIGKSKCRSEAPDSERGRRRNGFRQKENQRKSDKKNKVKEKNIPDQLVCRSDSRSEAGKYISDNLVKTSPGNKVASEDVSNLDMLANGVGRRCLSPRIAWVRCDDCHKWRCIPATLADTIEETNCIWICKDNMDKAFADCSIPQEKSNAEINAELDISDASVSQQSTWTLIKSNLFLHRSCKTQTIDEIMVCHCKPPTNGRKGCGDACLNRMLNIECVQGTCPCGDLCSNQQFQKRKYAELKSIKCGKKGYGLQSLDNISQGQFLIEYVGEVLDLHTYEERQRDYASRGHKHFYFMTLNGSEVIDACAKGNLGRFINHSCDPNCRTEKWMVNGEVCIGLFALRDIKKGEEVTFDYNYVRVFGAAAKKCVCGSSQCRGYIGGDPLSTEVIVQGDSDEEYPEPVMVCEDDEVGGSTSYISSTAFSFGGAEMQTAEILLKDGDKMGKPATSVAQLEDSHMENRTSTDNVVDGAELQAAEILLKSVDNIDKHATATELLSVTSENEDSKNTSASCVHQLQTSMLMEDSMEKLISAAQPVEVSPQTGGVASKSIFGVQENVSMEEESLKKHLPSIQKLDTCTPGKMPRKLLPDSVDVDLKCKSDKVDEKPVISKSNPLMKTARSSSSVKKGKSAHNVFNANKPQPANKSQVVSNKVKRSLEGSANARFEGVEEKLNDLLDADGGISKRKDSPRGYLKLLLLTAASGDRGNGEAIQSTRDLSMILDALLKTKSRVVLVDIINKNGLRMLHNIMKQYRRDFYKTPILRKLLKVLEYLAVREILTSEHINGGPPCPGMESFRESILALTEHADKQVHQIARSFRDRWIPWNLRKVGCMDKDDCRMELHKGLNCNKNSASDNYWRDQAVRPTEAIDCVKQSSLTAATVVAGNQEGVSAPCVGNCPTNGTKTRKRKSRWDQPEESNSYSSSQHKEQKIEPSLPHKLVSDNQPDMLESNLQSESLGSRSMQDDASRVDNGGRSFNDDFPPGFSSPLNRPVDPYKASSAATSLPSQNVRDSKCSFEVATGQSPHRFNSRLPVSYGIPLSTMQQFGTPFAETVESWVNAPGIPFHPFPPLPPVPRNRRDTPPLCTVEPMANCSSEEVRGQQGLTTNHADQSTPSTSSSSPPGVDVDGNCRRACKRVRNSSFDLGRRYFRQRKLNNSKLGPRWPRKRNGWGFMGNNSMNEMCNIAMGNAAGDHRSVYSSEDVSNRIENGSNIFYLHQQQQTQH
ncbi:histone-lysine N-methyltransferase ASHH2 isoform X2 [Malania oleifera]|uniref:histone-lysine N-methyltransferase ASHH2 isoform X2 n=1 Tax=Malania oleifera TaxID=397392 RepID=UPI0025AE6211|nr:histone-lysine N-methyltransferase ASHH2 isoform X2 [Malania oleifera]XP_057973980.1 histone-lysine N-methyltransferase ASHH2 isoform X2 [Malania oleifera]